MGLPIIHRQPLWRVIMDSEKTDHTSSDLQSHHETKIDINKSQETKKKLKKRPSNLVLNIMTALVGILTLAAGIGWLVYTYIVDAEVPYFAIPLIMCVPVIAAVAFRNIWD
jgi:hypothetical protein